MRTKKKKGTDRDRGWEPCCLNSRLHQNGQISSATWKIKKGEKKKVRGKNTNTHRRTNHWETGVSNKKWDWTVSLTVDVDLKTKRRCEYQVGTPSAVTCGSPGVSIGGCVCYGSHTYEAAAAQESLKWVLNIKYTQSRARWAPGCDTKAGLSRNICQNKQSQAKIITLGALKTETPTAVNKK